MLPISFTTEAWPSLAAVDGPRAEGHEHRHQLARARPRRPPVMSTSVPFSAPIFDPVTGASSTSRPAPGSASSTRRTSAGRDGRGLDVAEPGRAAAARMPSSAKTSRSTAVRSETQATDHVAVSASSRGVRARTRRRPPAAHARSRVRFQTVSGKPLSQEVAGHPAAHEPQPGEADAHRFSLRARRTSRVARAAPIGPRAARRRDGAHGGSSSSDR